MYTQSTTNEHNNSHQLANISAVTNKVIYKQYIQQPTLSDHNVVNKNIFT